MTPPPDIEALRRVLAADPDNRDALAELARALHSTGKSVEAYALFLDHRVFGEDPLRRAIGRELAALEAGSLARHADEGLVYGVDRGDGGLVYLSLDELQDAGRPVLAMDLLRMNEDWSLLESLQGFPLLRSLNMPSFATDEALACLAPLASLQELSLEHCDQITDQGLAELSALASLRELHLGDTNITGLGFRSWASPKALRKLNLRDTRVSNESLAHLSALTALQELDLGELRVNDQGLASLSALTSLELLVLAGEITDGGLAPIAAMNALRQVNLDRTSISDAGLVHLSSLSSLERLSLEGTGISDAGLSHLSGLVKLFMLNLRSTAITDAGLASLASLPALNEVWLSGCEGVTEDGARRMLPRVGRISI